MIAWGGPERRSSARQDVDESIGVVIALAVLFGVILGLVLSDAVVYRDEKSPATAEAVTGLDTGGDAPAARGGPHKVAGGAR